MKPGHIRVFDGLRITTEHMEHLQGSLHSAVEDLRTILGLGRVHYGFEVEAEGNNVVVHPGLAFDQQKNRIVLDEPKTVPVTFAPDEESKYVCIKYDQVEDGQVEGQFTLIWDTCAVVVRAAAPEPNDAHIAIARLDKTSGNGAAAFEVVSLLWPEADEELVDEEAAADEEPLEEATGEAVNGEQANGGEATPAQTTEGEVTGQPETPTGSSPAASSEDGAVSTNAAVKNGTTTTAAATNDASSPAAANASPAVAPDGSSTVAGNDSSAVAANGPLTVASEASSSAAPDTSSSPVAPREETAPVESAAVVEAPPTLRSKLTDRLGALIPQFTPVRPLARAVNRETEAQPATEEAPRRALAARGLGVRQGVVRLASGNDAGDYLGALLAEPLKRKLSAAKEGADAGELVFTLSAQDVGLDFPPASLTSHTLVKLWLAFDGGGQEGEEIKENKETKGAADKSAGPYAHGAKLYATAEGEATFADRDLQQFGLTKIYADSDVGAWHGAWPACELTERVVARLPFGLLAAGEARDDAGQIAALLGSLQLHVRVARADRNGFRVLCALAWAGTINEELIKTIEGRKPRLTWETLVAWKALGDPFALTR